MACWIWATMNQKVIVFDLAARAEGTLALGQALSGTLNSLSREPFFSANSWLCWALPPTHTPALKASCWQPELFLLVRVHSEFCHPNRLPNFRLLARWLPFRHKLQSVQSMGLKHGLISFDQEPVLINAYTDYHCFEPQFFRWLVLVGKLPKSGMGQSVSSVIFLHMSGTYLCSMD